VFGVTAALASVVTELFSRFIGLRGAYLLSGLRELVDTGGPNTDLSNAETDYENMQNLIRGGADAPAPQPDGQTAPATPSVTGALLGGPILGSQGMVGQIKGRPLTITSAARTGRLHKMTANPPASEALPPAGEAPPPAGEAPPLASEAPLPTGQAAQPAGKGVRSMRRSLPSYISAKSFAEAVIDLVVPDAAGKTTMDTIKANVDTLARKLPKEMSFGSSLQALVKNADDDVSRFRTAVEHWYDDHMSRVSGWYKRHVAITTLAFGAILIVLLNINVLTIGRTLYSESAVSTAVSAAAAKGSNCSASQKPQECLAQLQDQLSAAAAAGLPIGWGTVRDCQAPGAGCNWMDQRGLFSRHGGSFWQFVLVLVGFLLMVIAIVPGAQFWFGLLSKIGSIRSTGPKPAGAGS
jgi:hypothetical protein